MRSGSKPAKPALGVLGSADSTESLRIASSVGIGGGTPAKSGDAPKDGDGEAPKDGDGEAPKKTGETKSE